MICRIKKRTTEKAETELEKQKENTMQALNWMADTAKRLIEAQNQE